MSRPMNDDEVLTEMKKMVAFIKQEAMEKAREIQVKADEEFAIEKVSSTSDPLKAGRRTQLTPTGGGSGRQRLFVRRPRTSRRRTRRRRSRRASPRRCEFLFSYGRSFDFMIHFNSNPLARGVLMISPANNRTRRTSLGCGSCRRASSTSIRFSMAPASA